MDDMAAMRASIEAHFAKKEAEEAERMKDPAYRAAKEAEEAAQIAREAARLLQERTSALRARGVPAKDHAALLGDSGLKDTGALIAAREWLASEMPILVLSGMRGCGKTLAAGWAVANHQYGARFMDVSQFQRLSRYDDDAMKRVEGCGLLAIDDLGMEFADSKGSFGALFDGVFNARYAEQLRTVITTNVTAGVFRERYGERVADRIRESGCFVELDEQSLRGAK